MCNRFFYLAILTLLYSSWASHFVAIANADELDLTGETWVVNGVDNAGTSWDDSRLFFTSQSINGTSYDLTGYFDWIGSNGSLGRENFMGSLNEDSTINIAGFSLEPIPGVGGPTPTITTGNYNIILDGTGNSMIGDWSGGSGVIPGDFSTSRLPGDFNNDSNVNGADFLYMYRNWQSSIFSTSDLQRWMGNFGSSIPQLSTIVTRIPEPSSVIIFVCGVFLVCNTRAQTSAT